MRLMEKLREMLAPPATTTITTVTTSSITTTTVEEREAVRKRLRAQEARLKAIDAQIDAQRAGR
jgi:outer membrane protein TolC